MSGQIYDGPIIDAHHHLWDLRLGKHPWLQSGAADDELAPLRQNFLAGEYARLAQDYGIRASVHVETNWDPLDPIGEDNWLDSLERPAGIAARYVGYAPLLEPRAAAIIEQHAAHGRVAGIREILSWHPDPAKRRLPDNARLADPFWRKNLALLRRHNFSFDLLLSPWQSLEARQLADDFADISFVLNHCGSPMDRDAEGMQRWRQGLRALADAPNVTLKISDPVAYDPHWTTDSLAEIILTCIDTFGPDRVMFATDYPVAGLHIGFAEWISVFKATTISFSRDEQTAMFFATAARIYGIPANLLA